MSNGINPNKIMIGGYYELQMIGLDPKPVCVTDYYRGIIYADAIYPCGEGKFQSAKDNPRFKSLILNDEWLDRLGFSDDEVSSDFSTEYSLLGFEKHVAIIHLHKDDEYWLEIGCEHDREWVRKKVSFVHELQSIFYDHTGHSLTHNLNR